MPIAWEFRGSILTVTATGVVPNPEIERIILGEALSGVQEGEGIRVLWDARGAMTPLSAEDVEWRTQTMASLAERGVLSRFALLMRPEWRDTIAVARLTIPQVVRPLEFEVFSEEDEAWAWLLSLGAV